MMLPLQELELLPDSASYEKSDGRVHLNVRRVGKAIAIGVTCDSIKRAVTTVRSHVTTVAQSNKVTKKDSSTSGLIIEIIAFALILAMFVFWGKNIT